MEQELNIRLLNRMNSPKQNGSSDVDSLPYLKELGIDIQKKTQPIKFAENVNEHIHRWSPYVQGFSAAFVQSQFDKYTDEYQYPIILDPFAGCGTVLVQSKLNGFQSYGTELNPLLQFVAQTKLNSWDVSPIQILKTYNSILAHEPYPSPAFLKSSYHFKKEVLHNLETLKGGIEDLPEKTRKQKKIKDLIKVAFTSILVDCSNLKRSPCLGYKSREFMKKII